MIHDYKYLARRRSVNTGNNNELLDLVGGIAGSLLLAGVLVYMVALI